MLWHVSTGTIIDMTTYVLPFEKMHGLGNDFIVLERRHLPIGVDENALAKLLCDRHFSIGADGIIIVDFSPSRDVDFVWSYYNSNGSEAEMCGNGMRCFAKYVFERGFIDEVSFSVLTKAGIIKPTIEQDGTVTVNMGVPVILDKLKEKIIVDSKELTFTYVEIGNPHCVIFLDHYINDSDFLNYGPKIEKHNKFPKGVNVEFVNVIKKNELKVRVWERGCGPTLACGTGACATLVAANINNLCDDCALVYLPGGCLKIQWDKSSNNVFLNGPAAFLYTGQLNLEPKLVCKTTSIK